MRRRFRYDHERGRMVEIATRDPHSRLQLMPDIAPYQSMIDGSMITGRRQHREHLKRHGCEEVGNERPDFAAHDWTPPEAEVRASILEATRQVEWGEAPTMERLKDESPKWRKDMGLEG